MYQEAVGQYGQVICAAKQKMSIFMIVPMEDGEDTTVTTLKILEFLVTNWVSPEITVGPLDHGLQFL